MAYREITSPRWKRLRAAVLRDEPLCRMCAARGLTKAAREVDHVVARSKGGAMWDESNLQPLCRVCHRAKTRAAYPRKYLATEDGRLIHTAGGISRVF